MWCAFTSTYPENLGSGGLLPAELRGRVCLFVFLFVRHATMLGRKPRRCVYALNLGGTGISPPDKSTPDKNPPAKSLPSQMCPGQKTPGEKFSRQKTPPRTKAPPDKNFPGPGHPTSGDIFYCSSSRQLNHSS